MPLTTGQILNDRYRIVKPLKRGGFGAVYRAWDMTLQRACAIKENLETLPAAGEQFLREARILAQLSHPNLPRVHDAFMITDQGQYLVMEYIEGEDLGEMLEAQPSGGYLPVAQVLVWILQVCEALEYLHQHDPPIIHRDLKPSNIKITPDSEHGRAVLVDFGIAKVYEPHTRTTVGARAITSGYSPPEQYGKGVTDAQSDVYALGATLYHLLTGRQPPDSVDMMTRNVLPPPAHEINSAVPPGVSAAIQKAMQPRRIDRWQSVAEFRGALASPIYHKPTLPRQGETEQAITQKARARAGQVTTYHVWRQWSCSQIGSMVVFGLVIVFGILGVALEVSRVGQALQASQTAAAAWREATLTVIPSLAALLPTEPPAFTPQPPSPPPTPAPTGIYPIEIMDERGVAMRLVPAGSFIMGGDPDVDMAECDRLRISGACERSMFEDEQPIHMVTLSDFYIDLTEVTNGTYARCVDAGVCLPPTDFSSYTRPSYYGDSNYADYPVIHITWNQSVKFCQWRGARLPGEAEWEKAARGADGRRFPWGNEFDGSLTNFCDANCPLTWANPAFDDGQADTAPVGFYPGGASPYGLVDMAGNVWEWVSDWYLETFYDITPLQDPFGAESGQERVLRGGGWSYSGYYLHASFRGRNIPNNPTTYTGFRCVREP